MIKSKPPCCAPCDDCCNNYCCPCQPCGFDCC
jgi:hypothetical protein